MNYCHAFGKNELLDLFVLKTVILKNCSAEQIVQVTEENHLKSSFLNETLFDLKTLISGLKQEGKRYRKIFQRIQSFIKKLHILIK